MPPRERPAAKGIGMTSDAMAADARQDQMDRATTTSTSRSATSADTPRATTTSADQDLSAGRSPGDMQTDQPDSDAHLPVPYAPPRRRALWQWFRQFLGIQPRDDLRESLQDVLDNGHGEFHALTDKERLMLRNVLELRDVRVEDVMVPRADIDAVDLSMPLIQVIRAFEDAGHSRLPVTRESLDDPVGLVHIKDVMGFITAKATIKRRRATAKAMPDSTLKSETPKAISAKDKGVPTKGSNGKSESKTRKPQHLDGPSPGAIDLARVDLTVALKATKLTRDVLYVPPSMPVGDLLVKMQADRMHMAIVVDEYGGTDGLVTIEDLVEEIVGEISDEHDDEEAALIVSAGPSSFVADARTPIEDLQEQLIEGFEPDAEMLEEVDTLGGLLFSHLGRVPVRGEIVDLSGAYEFEVIDADPRRVKRVRISPRRLAQPTRGLRAATGRSKSSVNAAGSNSDDHADPGAAPEDTKS
jgi:CBS domain containing-hemolysin-like protein